MINFHPWTGSNEEDFQKTFFCRKNKHNILSKENIHN